MKIELEYEPATGNIKDGDVFVAQWMGLENREIKQLGEAVSVGLTPDKISISELKDLKEAGYTAHEIAQLRASGVL